MKHLPAALCVCSLTVRSTLQQYGAPGGMGAMGTGMGQQQYPPGGGMGMDQQQYPPGGMGMGMGQQQYPPGGMGMGGGMPPY